MSVVIYLTVTASENKETVCTQGRDVDSDHHADL